MMLCGIVCFVGFTVLLLSLKPMLCPGFDWLNMCFCGKQLLCLRMKPPFGVFLFKRKPHDARDFLMNDNQ